LDEQCEQIPTVILDERYYRTIDDLQKRFPDGAPSLKKCRRFEVIGDIRFGEDVVVKGDVKLEAREPAFLFNVTLDEDRVFNSSLYE